MSIYKKVTVFIFKNNNLENQYPGFNQLVVRHIHIFHILKMFTILIS